MAIEQSLVLIKPDGAKRRLTGLVIDRLEAAGLTLAGAKLVSVTGAAVDKLVKANPYYAHATIPAGLYPGNPQATKTYGVLATFVSSTRTPTDTVYQVVKAVFEGFGDFKKLHPAFQVLKPENMIKDGLSAPLHDGAVKYYKEKGWMK